MQEIIQGEIVELTEDGGIVIVAAVPSLDKAIIRRYKKVQIALCDGRAISVIQRRKIYALLKEISIWMGDNPESTKKTMKMDFIVNRLENMGKKMFSLSTVDMNTASEFISYLIEFVVEHDIPCSHTLVEMCEDVQHYVYTCMINKRCAVCGNKSDLHHLDTIGMGNDRTKVSHLGRKALPLCRTHHIECHSMGNKPFMDRYHLDYVRIDNKILKTYRLKG